MSENQQENKLNVAENELNAAEQEGQGTLKEHFQELRKRLLYCFIVVAVAFFIIASCFAETLVQLISIPVKAKGIEFIYVGLAEALTAQLQVSFIAAMMVASPFIFYQIWGFIEPALYDNEKKALLIFMACSVLLFLIGICFGYGVVFLSAITFFVYTGAGIATPMLSISQYVGFMFTFVLSFGIVFEMPILTYVLCRVGIVTPDQLTACRKYVILCIFIIAAFLTPPDVLSQVLMALPMIVLYEVGII
ncbi:MAG: twin-arginine translocase subunit TatC, partial [Acidaminococcaceae bacterium]|nr:twin-arginine translocase subunit TatC [Acidaminococcaceae bacterium]